MQQQRFCRNTVKQGRRGEYETKEAACKQYTWTKDRMKQDRRQTPTLAQEHREQHMLCAVSLTSK